METFYFGVALNHLRAGRKVARVGWKGKGMWLYLIAKPAKLDYAPIDDSLPDAFDGSYPLDPFIVMKTAQGNVVPWLASQTDMLATDYVVVD